MNLYTRIAKWLRVPVVSCLLSGCSATSHDMSSVPLMSFDQCLSSKYCRVSGELSLKEVDHVLMGRLTMDDGKCLNVSLPKRTVQHLRSEGTVSQVVVGRVFPSYPDPDLAEIYIAGRRVGLSQCGNILLFVE